MTLHDILDEWDGGSYYTDEYLAEAYTEFLLTLLDLGAEPDPDPSPSWRPDKTHARARPT